jgi:hypothetical protein
MTVRGVEQKYEFFGLHELYEGDLSSQETDERENDIKIVIKRT